MSLLISLRSELVKSRRTSIWYLCLVTSIVAPVFGFLADSAPYKIPDLKQDPWNVFLIGMGGLAFNIMIMPFFLMLICTLLAQLEYRNNTWKQVYVSPQPLLNVFLSKFLHMQLLVLGVFILSNLLMVVSLLAIHYLKVDLNLSAYELDWNRYFSFIGRIYVSVLGISAIQFWLGLRFKSFIAPLVIGICLWLAATMMVEEYPWAHDDKFPYIYPMRNFFPKYPSEGTTIVWGSIGYMVLFFVFGFIDFKRRRSKS